MEYAILSHARTCASCGAGSHNNYEHNGDCLINLEKSDLIKFWNKGWNARLEAGDGDTILPKHLPDPELIAFGMGMACAARMRETKESPPMRVEV